MFIGQRIRALRQRKGLTVEALAVSVGVHKGHLSRIERGEKAASVATLTAIARALEAEIAELFGEKAGADDVLVVRQAERRGREASDPVHALLPQSSGRNIAVYLVEPRDDYPADDLPVHGGHEVVYTLRGRVELAVADRRIMLEPGDCAAYDANLPHRMRRRGHERAEVLIIVAG